MIVEEKKKDSSFIFVRTRLRFPLLVCLLLFPSGNASNLTCSCSRVGMVRTCLVLVPEWECFELAFVLVPEWDRFELDLRFRVGTYI